MRHGIPTLVKLLGPESHYPLIKAVIGLCRNLGLGPQNQQYLRDAGAIPKLVDLLFRADSEMKRGVYSEHEGNDPRNQNLINTIVVTLALWIFFTLIILQNTKLNIYDR